MNPKRMYFFLLVLLAFTILFSNKVSKTFNEDFNKRNKNGINQTKNMKVNQTLFGHINGTPVHLFSLVNTKGMEVEITEFGAIVVSVKVPDKSGKIDDITLGYDNLEGYREDPYYFGATIGRVANRTSGASFVLDGKKHELAPNTLPDFGKNHLHGGDKGFNKVLWKGKSFQKEDHVGVSLSYLSEDGEEGYPGNLEVEVVYKLNQQNELMIEYHATSDQKTIVNMTHHSYFNLKGEGQGDVLDHEVMINADKYTPADENLIPTGEISGVKGLPVDFTSFRRIGSRLDEMQQTKFTGYDLNYIINHKKPGSLELAAKALDKQSGRLLEVYTTQPCMHFYTGNFLEGKTGKAGKSYPKYGAFCFEPQGYPDAINKPEFESIILHPDKTYEETIIYRFSIND